MGGRRPGVAEIWVQLPAGPLNAPMVKRKSYLASNEEFWVRVLIGVLRTEGFLVATLRVGTPLGRSASRLRPGGDVPPRAGPRRGASQGPFPRGAWEREERRVRVLIGVLRTEGLADWERHPV